MDPKLVKQKNYCYIERAFIFFARFVNVLKTRDVFLHLSFETFDFV